MIFLGIFAVVCIIAGTGLALVWVPMGSGAKGKRLARIKNSPNFHKGQFHNLVPGKKIDIKRILQSIKDFSKGQKRTPDDPVPLIKISAQDYKQPPKSGLRITWIGHSTVLIEIDGKTVLLDPVFSDRSSPVSFIGPKRFFKPPISIAKLPMIDTVIISHDHYDHLDHRAICGLEPKVKTFVVSLGIGAHLEGWGVDQSKIVELDWWEDTSIDEALKIVACPARHFSGRSFFGNRTLWSSWVLQGSAHKVFFTGDTGFMPNFEKVGERFGPFDLSLVKIGSYGRGWPEVHLFPEQAARLNQLVQGKLMMPVHWGTFNLSYHAWTEPVERLIVAAEKEGINLIIPKPGQIFEIDNPPKLDRYWPDLKWEKPGKED